MTSVALPKAEGRKLLGRLRAARAESDQGRIVDLLKQLALVAPELQGAACEIVRGDDDDGAEQRESWAAGFFISSEPQPPAELVPLAVVSPSKALVVKRRLLPTKTYAELKAKIEAKAEPEPESEILDDEAFKIVPALREEIMSPAVGRALDQVLLLNQKHAVIGNYGSKCAVLSWERWNVDPEMMVPIFQSFSDFRNRYMNRFVWKETEDGMEKVAAGKYWLSHPKRRSYEGVSFEPGAPEVLRGNRLNLYRGFAVEPRKGSWKRLRSHIYRVLGNGDRRAGRYIVRWLAWAVQNPGSRAEAVLVLQGDEGAGKGTLAAVLLKIFGIYSLPISDPKHLIGSFSGHLQHCIFLFLDEAFWAGNVAAEGRLKNLVTEKTITIEPKYFQTFQVPNVLHIMLASNNDWVVPAGHGSRRYAVFKVSSAKCRDFEYFNELNEEIDGGGAEGMLWDLLRLDLKGWHPKQIYETAALVEQKQHSLRGLDAWIEAMLQEGVLPVPLSEAYPNRCLSDHLLAAAKEHDPHTNWIRVLNKLKAVFKIEDFNIQTARGWAFPPLAECRAAWERRNGGSWNWHRKAGLWGKPTAPLDLPSSLVRRG